MNGNVKINRGIKALLRLVIERMGVHTAQGARAHRILHSGQQWMRQDDVARFQRIMGA